MIRNPEYAESNLFEGVNLVARRQQVQDLRMQLALSKGDTYTAATIAIKMLVEDEVCNIVAHGIGYFLLDFPYKSLTLPFIVVISPVHY